MDAEKDRQLLLSQSQAAVQIQQFKAIAAEANLKAEETSKANSLLRNEVEKEQAETRKTTTELVVRAQRTEEFTQQLAQQQKSISQQIHATPLLSDSQINKIAEQLKPFAGQTVSIHTMLDAHCQRLGAQFQRAFEIAGIKIPDYSTVVGPNYQGVLIVVKNPNPSPHAPLADALFNAVKSVGIDAHGVADPSVAEGLVAIYIGPD